MQGTINLPGQPTPPPQLASIGFGTHVHSISLTVQNPFAPYDDFRAWGSPCYWSTISPNGTTYNWSCLDQIIAFAAAQNVDVMYTIGGVPPALSTIATDPGPFPVANNGISQSCNSGSCTETILPLQRPNAVVGDSITIAGASGCPQTANITTAATVVSNGSDYPWPITLNIGSGSTNSSACGGSSVTLTDNTQVSAGLTRCFSQNNTYASGCYSPADINIDGTGNDCQFAAATGACSSGGFLSNLLAHLSTNDPTHRIKQIEIWNEPQIPGYWNGSVAQMARIMKDVYTQVKASSRSDIEVHSPPPSGGPPSVPAYMTLLCNDPSQPMQYSDVIDFHSYDYPQTGTPDPAAVSLFTTSLAPILATCPGAANKRLWVTEGGWGEGSFASASDNLGPNSGTQAALEKAAWAFQWYAQHQSNGIARAYWFAWDNRCNSGLSCTHPNLIQPSGIAAGIAHDVFAGATMAQAATKDTSNNWTMQLTRPGGYQALVLWNNNLTVPGSYMIPVNQYVQYRDISGNVTPIASGATSVPTNADPITLENEDPPTHFVQGQVLPTGTAGDMYSATLMAVCAALPCTYTERSLPSVLAPLSMTLNGSTGVFTGISPQTGTFCPLFGIQDSSSPPNTYAEKICFTIQAATGLTILNGNPPGGEVNVPYDFPLMARGGVGSLHWTLSSGANPSGTALTQVNDVGHITGTPDTPQTVTPVYQVCDSQLPTSQCTLAPAIGTYSITIQSGPPPPSRDNVYTPWNGTACVPTYTGTEPFAVFPTRCMNSQRANMPSPGSTVTVGSGASLQTALNAATCGQTIKLTSGATYSGHITFPALNCSVTNWLTIEVTNMAALPPEGTRLTPCYHNIASLPGRPAYPCPSPIDAVATIQATASGTLFDMSTNAISFVHFIGIHWHNGCTAPCTAGPLITMGANTHDIVFDQWLGSGQEMATIPATSANFTETTRFVAHGQSHNIVFADGSAWDFYCVGGNISGASGCQAQVFGSGTGTTFGSNWGNYKWVNNFMESAGEVVENGGGLGPGGPVTGFCAPNCIDDNPADYEVRLNHMFRPLTWMPPLTSNGAGYPSVQNIYECKTCERTFFEGNILENVWAGYSQAGFAILINPKSQAAAGQNQCPNCAIHDFIARYNLIKGMCSSMQIANGTNDNGILANGGFNYSIHDNLFDNMMMPNAFKCNTGGQVIVQLTENVTQALPTPGIEPLNHVSVNHNTFVVNSTPVGNPAGMLGIGGSTLAVGNDMSNIQFQNNLSTQGSSGTINVSGSSSSCAKTTAGSVAVGACWHAFPPSTFNGNAIVSSTNIWNTITGNTQCLGQTYSNIFVNYGGGSGGDYHLATGPCHLFDDGGTTDPGANIDLVNANTNGVN